MASAPPVELELQLSWTYNINRVELAVHRSTEAKVDNVFDLSFFIPFGLKPMDSNPWMCKIFESPGRRYSRHLYTYPTELIAMHVSEKLNLDVFSAELLSLTIQGEFTDVLDRLLAAIRRELKQELTGPVTTLTPALLSGVMRPPMSSTLTW